MSEPNLADFVRRIRASDEQAARDAPCPPDAQLLALVMDAVGNSELREHIASCDACQRAVEKIQADVENLRAAQGRAFIDDTKERVLPQVAAATAAQPVDADRDSVLELHGGAPFANRSVA